MRPVYETDENREQEEKISTYLADKWGCEVAKMPPRYEVDRVFLKDGKPVAWVEIKRRKRTLMQFDTVWLGAHKAVMGVNLSKLSGLPFFYAIGCNDCVAYIKVEGVYEMRFGGRKDRGDWQDMEPVLEIPSHTFTKS